VVVVVEVVVVAEEEEGEEEEVEVEMDVDVEVEVEMGAEVADLHDHGFRVGRKGALGGGRGVTLGNTGRGKLRAVWWVAA
jgi:hypothetical protein